uniref:Uncharacterized protein n=1 Tax=Cyprinodon variegatus TaxID=28743 RepID=A0A3Q2E7Q1_CYPVA
MLSQGGHHYKLSYIEVVRVNLQFLRVVHNTQFGIGLLDVVQVLHCGFKATHHSFPMLSHFWISGDGCGGGKIAKSSKVPLGPWKHNQKPKNEKVPTIIADHHFFPLMPQLPDRWLIDFHVICFGGKTPCGLKSSELQLKVIIVLADRADTYWF